MLKKGYQVWVVMYDNEAKAVFDNYAGAVAYIKNYSLESAEILQSIYL